MLNILFICLFTSNINLIHNKLRMTAETSSISGIYKLYLFATLSACLFIYLLAIILICIHRHDEMLHRNSTCNSMHCISHRHNKYSNWILIRWEFVYCNI